MSMVDFNITATELCITSTISIMLEENKYVRCLLIDFSKAFDTVNHLLLVSKLKLLQLPDNIIQWVVSFLTDREQFTKIGDRRLATRIITRSIVQGSGIGPTLFIIFVINLRPLGLTNHITKYADDTSLLVPEKADTDITAELQHVLKWAEVNELNINTAKTKELVFH